MAGETGSARQEAERLVATVLAMAAQSGARPDDDSISGTSARIVEGLGTLGDTLAGMVGHLAGGLGGQRATDEPARGQHADEAAGAAGGQRADEAAGAAAGAAGGQRAGEVAGAAGGQRAGAATGAAGGQRADGERDVWGAATGDRRDARPRDGAVRYGFATGSAECCVCPICRTIAGMRNPTPEAAARLATGAGDFAAGMASLMRAFSAMSGSRPRPSKPSKPSRTAPPPVDPDVAWSAATRTAERPETTDPAPDEDASPWAAATRAAVREAEAEAALRKAREAEAETARREARKAEAEAALRKAREAEAETARREARKAEAEPEPRGRRAQGPESHAGRPGDVWAAATAPGVDRGDADVTGGPAVDDDAGV